MPRPLRLSFVALGLALALYGTASLTGGWLGTPPWWDAAAVSVAHLSEKARADLIDIDVFVEWRRDGSSVVVILAGLALAVWGARPRRQAPVVTRA